MNQLPLEQLLVGLQIPAVAGLCLRILWTRLYRVYTWFFIYLLLVLLQTIVLSYFPVQSAAYLYIWMISEALVVAVYTLVVLETYAVILRDLPGIATVARQYMTFAIFCAVVVSLLLVGFEKTPKTIPQYFVVCERAVISSLLAFVLLSMIFLVYYPVPLTRNAVTYSAGFAIYFLAKSITLFVANLRYYLWRPVDMVLLGLSVACLLFWLLTLNKAGEAKTVLVGHRWNLDDENRVLSKLKAINDSLLRPTKK
jgi:hypothetical protein